jgi:crotonobetainyl-CoA:carnitine CoA-transferase CaiB-like acyl-CoA transferase
MQEMIYNFGQRLHFDPNPTLTQLKDLVVLELASVLAGPGVGQFFAELGARVIKVENLKTSGDVTRSWKLQGEKTDDRSAYFCSVNWGKESIAVDLAAKDGQAIVQHLAEQSDIVIASYKPGDAEKLGVDFQTLSRNNADLIYGQITGYGSHNQRVGYDAIIQAESGFMSMNAEPGGKSLKIPVALMDVLAGHHLKEGLLLALLEKQRTGQGKLVEVSLIQAAVASLANQATNYLVGGTVPSKQGSAHPNIAPYGDIFETADAKEIILAVGTDRQFDILINILSIRHITDSFPFGDNSARVRNRGNLNLVLQDAIGRWQSSDLLPVLQSHKIPAGMIRSVAEALENREAQELLLSGDNLRGVRTFTGRGVSFSSHLLPPPHFGEHSRSILEGMLKISPISVNKLYSSGIIA